MTLPLDKNVASFSALTLHTPLCFLDCNSPEQRFIHYSRRCILCRSLWSCSSFIFGDESRPSLRVGLNQQLHDYEKFISSLTTANYLTKLILPGHVAVAAERAQALQHERLRARANADCCTTYPAKAGEFSEEPLISFFLRSIPSSAVSRSKGPVEFANIVLWTHGAMT